MGVSATQTREGWQVVIRAMIDGTIYVERRHTVARTKAAALAWGEKRRRRLLIDGPLGQYEPPPTQTYAAPNDDEEWQIWLFQNGSLDCGWIYFVAGPGWAVKIGWALDVGERVAGLQIGCPSELTVLGVMRGNRSQEALAHRHFAEHHLRGEWFAPGEELMRFIADHAENFGQPDGTSRATEAALFDLQRRRFVEDSETVTLRDPTRGLL